MDYLTELAPGLAWPLLRLLAAMALGILAASILEALRWDRFMARLTAPLARLAHMGEAPAASFVMAFFSGHAASTLLGEAYAEGRLGKKELILSNLFNSTPAYTVHLPALAALAVALLGRWGAVYIALGLASALLRTFCTALAACILLPAAQAQQAGLPERKKISLSAIAAQVFIRFTRRLKKLLKFTVPIFVLFYIIQDLGCFTEAQRFLGAHASFLTFLSPEALGIVALALSAEGTAAMSASAALLNGAAISGPEIVAALLTGNILSSPVRAIRHQLPAYAGYYQPKLALELVLYSQSIRCLSMIAVLAAYLYFAF